MFIQKHIIGQQSLNAWCRWSCNLIQCAVLIKCIKSCAKMTFCVSVELRLQSTYIQRIDLNQMIVALLCIKVIEYTDYPPLWGFRYCFVFMLLFSVVFCNGVIICTVKVQVQQMSATVFCLFNKMCWCPVFWHVQS